MVRHEMTARKVSYSLAPRRIEDPLRNKVMKATGPGVTFAAWQKFSIDKHAVDVETADLLDLEIETTTIRLGLGAYGGVEEDNRVNNMPAFDIDDKYNQDNNMGQYEVQRRPITLKDSLSKHGKTLIEKVMRRTREKYPNSAWVLLWKNSDSDGITVLPQEHCHDGEYAELEEILEGGKLNGCELRGCAGTGQFGLVATKRLEKDTVVAVECGVLWTEPEHDSVLEDVGDPMIGLTSNLISSQVYLKPLASSAEWVQFVYRSRDVLGDKFDEYEPAPGFVMESSTHGNETRHIDDPSWLFVSEGDGLDIQKPNLKALPVLDLKRGILTVAFETSRDVKEDTELTMDWGCWSEVSNRILPGQAQISWLLHRHLGILKQIAKEEGVSVEIEKPVATKPIFYDVKKTIYACIGNDRIDDCGDGAYYGEEFRLLEAMVTAHTDSKDKDEDTTDSSDGDPEWCITANEAIDESFDGLWFATCCADDLQGLSHRSRRAMNEVPDTACTGFSDMKHRLEKSYQEGVEVIEIIDPCHPVRLFCIPGEKACGLRAKKAFKKGAPVLCYGGHIEQTRPSTKQWHSYIFDVDMPSEYQGPSLHINGEKSIGGKINDSWSPPCLGARKANLIAIMHWDAATKTPQILFRATRNIKAGEELLYNYGEEYWKVMWIHMMRGHASYAMEANNHCKQIRAAIISKTSMTDDDLVLREQEMLHNQHPNPVRSVLL